eukprot:Platyproteum_vivax@DN4802_c0_g1_i2.p1
MLDDVSDLTWTESKVATAGPIYSLNVEGKDPLKFAIRLALAASSAFGKKLQISSRIRFRIKGALNDHLDTFYYEGWKDWDWNTFEAYDPGRPRNTLAGDTADWQRDLAPWNLDPRLKSRDVLQQLKLPDAYFLHKKIQPGFEGPSAPFVLSNIDAVTLRAGSLVPGVTVKQEWLEVEQSAYSHLFHTIRPTGHFYAFYRLYNANKSLYFVSAELDRLSCQTYNEIVQKTFFQVSQLVHTKNLYWEEFKSPLPPDAQLIALQTEWNSQKKPRRHLKHLAEMIYLVFDAEPTDEFALMTLGHEAPQSGVTLTNFLDPGPAELASIKDSVWQRALFGIARFTMPAINPQYDFTRPRITQR